MINKHLNIIFKLLFFIILFLFVCQPIKSQSAGAIHPTPTEITLSGRLLDGDSVGKIGIPGAYIFALANDYKTVLGYSKTKNGVYPERGSWEITGLPVSSEVKEIILIGFHPNTKFNWVTAKVKTGIFNKDVGDLIIKAGPYHDLEFGGPGAPGLLNLILHEVGVFILDNQTKSMEGLIDYLLNEAKKLDNGETKMSEKDMAQLIELLNEPTATMMEHILEKLYSSYCNSGQNQKKKCTASGVITFSKIVRNGNIAEVYIYLIADVYIDHKVVKSYSYKEEVLFQVVKIGGIWKINKK